MKRQIIAVLFVTILAVGWFAGRPALAETVDRIVAKVGTQVITQSDVSKALAEQKTYLEEMLGPQKAPAELEKFKRNVVDEMIMERLLESEIKKDGVSVGTTEVDGEFQTRLRQYQLTETQLKEKLAREGLTLESYRNSIKKQLEKRAFIQKKIAPTISISEYDVQKEYEKNIAKYQTYQKVRFTEVFLTAEKFADGQEMLKIAQDIQARLKKGGAVGDLIKKYSSGAFAKTGGDSGVINASDLRQEIQDVLAALPLGGVSQVLSTNAGVFIFKLISHSDPKPMPYSRVATHIRAAQADRLVAEGLRKYLLGVRERTYVEIE